MAELAGRKAVITGASRGIGAALAERFAAEGASLALVARTTREHDHLPGSLEQTRAACARHGGQVEVVVADLSRPPDRVRLVEELSERLGAVDTLVNNAAANFFIPFGEYSEKRLRILWEVNVMAAFDLAQRLLPGMRAAGRGWVLNISSQVACHPRQPFTEHERNSGCIAYGMTKSALDRLSTGLAAELLEDGIVVHSLSPDQAVATPGTVALGMLPEDSAMIEAPEQMAEAAVLLCTLGTEQSGRIGYSGELLREFLRPVRTLDGSARYTGPYALDIS